MSLRVMAWKGSQTPFGFDVLPLEEEPIDPSRFMTYKDLADGMADGMAKIQAIPLTGPVIVLDSLSFCVDSQTQKE